MKKVLMRNHDVTQPGKSCHRFEILVVDDISDTLLILEDMLQKQGYIVTGKENSKQGLDAAISGNFDLIILDIDMPGMDGFEVCRQLKKNPKTKNIPVIFLTFKEGIQYKIKALELGAADYITKPLVKYDILPRVKAHAILSRLTKTLSDDRYEILVVDDNPDFLLFLEDMLQKAGYGVTCKESGEEGLKAAKTGNFDLILLDIVMPGIDGFEVFRQLKKDENTRDIPVIFVTIKDELEYLIEGFKLGAADFIIKPFTKYEILARVKPHVQLYRMEKILSRDVKEHSTAIVDKIPVPGDDRAKCLEMER